MAHTTTIAIRGDAMKTHLFQVELEHEEDSRWSAWIEALPGCSAWGYTKDEALEAIKDTAPVYLEVLVAKGQPIPVAKAAETIDAPMVAVTL
jgi:predicted RNase H-like HicB family nuclease